MSIFQAAVLGVVQGLTEFLPVSSSGHLMLARALMGITDAQAAAGAYQMLDVLLHVGTLLALLVYFWKDWIDMLRHPVKNRTLLLLFLASLPSLIPPLFLKDAVAAFESGWFMGISLLITGLLLLLTEIIARARENRASKQVSIPVALVMGVMQALKLILGPGASRSGSTIAGGVFAGLDKKTAAKFSFMMSAPAILASLVYEGKEALDEGFLKQLELVPTAVGVVVAAVVGYLAVRLMMKLITSRSLLWFALYVAVLGIAILMIQLCGASARFGLPAFDVPSLTGAVRALTCIA